MRAARAAPRAQEMHSCSPTTSPPRTDAKPIARRAARGPLAPWRGDSADCRACCPRPAPPPRPAAAPYPRARPACGGGGPRRSRCRSPRQRARGRAHQLASSVTPRLVFGASSTGIARRPREPRTRRRRPGRWCRSAAAPARRGTASLCASDGTAAEKSMATSRALQRRPQVAGDGTPIGSTPGEPPASWPSAGSPRCGAAHRSAAGRELARTSGTRSGPCARSPRASRRSALPRGHSPALVKNCFTPSKKLFARRCAAASCLQRFVELAQQVAAARE